MCGDLILFNDEVRHMRAAAFVDELVSHLKMSSLWVGSDFAMGYKREGNVDFLREQGKEKGFEVEVIDLIVAQGETVSSTLIRQALDAGEMEKAAEWLASLCAARGSGAWREAWTADWFPTANVEVWGEQVIPRNGVYAGWGILGTERFMAMTNVGVRPHFDGNNITVEAYLLDFDRDIYGSLP
ncbi:MAG: riboflavin kinase [Anaerolineae bacterium]